MKFFYLFVWPQYEARGGWGDYQGTFASIEGCYQFMTTTYQRQIEEIYYYHIVDQEGKEIIDGGILSINEDERQTKQIQNSSCNRK